jgi:DNA-binding NtrC family response regulator
MVVGRDRELGRVIAEATQPWMFETVVCSSCWESLDLLDGEDFALIFCEERWEGGTYRDLLSAMGSRKAPVVVMISGENRDLVFREAMELGAFDVAANPCSRQDAQWMVIRATQKHRGIRMER